MLARQPTFRSWFWCSSSASSGPVRGAGSVWSSAVAATGAGATAPGPVQLSFALPSSEPRAAGISRALKDGSITATAIRNFGDSDGMPVGGP